MVLILNRYHQQCHLLGEGMEKLENPDGIGAQQWNPDSWDPLVPSSAESGNFQPLARKVANLLLDSAARQSMSTDPSYKGRFLVFFWGGEF